MAFVDACVEKIVNAVQAAGIADRTTFLIVSDHGFKAYKNQIRANTALQQAGLGDKAYVLPESGTAFVYVSEDVLIPRVRDVLTGVEGIDRIIGASEYPDFGLPTPEKDQQFGQLLLSAKDGYSFCGATRGPVTAAVPQTGGSHGYLASDPDMNAIFIAVAIECGRREKSVRFRTSTSRRPSPGCLDSSFSWLKGSQYLSTKRRKPLWRHHVDVGASGPKDCPMGYSA